MDRDSRMRRRHAAMDPEDPSAKLEALLADERAGVPPDLDRQAIACTVARILELGPLPRTKARGIVLASDALDAAKAGRLGPAFHLAEAAREWPGDFGAIIRHALEGGWQLGERSRGYMGGGEPHILVEFMPDIIMVRARFAQGPAEDITLTCGEWLAGLVSNPREG